jgi:hypothetical protein
MPTEQDLISRLMISKKIMDKHNSMNRGSQGNIPTTPMVEEYQPVNATYNLPQELLSEQPVQQKTYNTEVPTDERILNSKLPDEIKKLMMEHPIEKPTMGVNTGTAISNELVEKATRLMNTKANGDLINENVVKRQPQQQVQQTSQLSAKQIKSIVKETVEDVLKENGLLTESTTKSDELFKFRVGEHIFEGKVLRIRKISK